MATQKLTRYKIPVSPRFLSNHPRRGQQTLFIQKIQLGLNILVELQGDAVIDLDPKIHTIRKNFKLWHRRMHKVSIGKAVIDLCYWKLPGGRFTPCNELITFATLDKDSECGVQKIIFKKDLICTSIETSYAKNLIVPVDTITNNDGLSPKDFRAWFKGYDLSEPMAIIHFTKFRY